MTSYAYDIDNFLISTMRSIEAYVRDMLQDDPALGENVDVEMSFPDTRNWTKSTPLAKSLVHFELDDAPEMKTGFGVLKTYGEIDDDGLVVESEAHMHHLNFDVGIWTSAESGGTTKRMQIRQALINLFGTATGKITFNEATDGLQVVSFSGGGDVLDRVNDVPIWRTTGITLVISVFARLAPAEAVQVPLDVTQHQKLSIVGEEGESEHIVTDEEPWT